MQHKEKYKMRVFMFSADFFLCFFAPSPTRRKIKAYYYFVWNCFVHLSCCCLQSLSVMLSFCAKCFKKGSRQITSAYSFSLKHTSSFTRKGFHFTPLLLS